MIDIHCHILPNVDDGSKDLQESIEMAKIAESEGIKKIVNTSHYHPSFEYEKGEVIIDKLNSFNKLLKDQNINIEVIVGNELYYTVDLLETLNDLDFYTINNGRYLLIEFPPTQFPQNLCDIIYEIKLKGYIPILAHVERYVEVQDNPNLIFECIKEGAIIQINASSILAKKGSKIEKICDILLSNNMVHVVGTDAHSCKRRRPFMKESYNYVVSKYGRGMGDNLFSKNSSLIIDDKEIIKFEPKRYVEKRSFFSKIFKK